MGKITATLNLAPEERQRFEHVILRIRLHRAFAGDSEAGRNALAVLARWLEAGEPIPEDIAKVYAIALKRIAEGVDPGRALFVKRRRGNTWLKTEERDITVGVMMDGAMRDGATSQEQAFEQGLEHLRQNVGRPGFDYLDNVLPEIERMDVSQAKKVYRRYLASKGNE